MRCVLRKRDVADFACVFLGMGAVLMGVAANSLLAGVAMLVFSIGVYLAARIAMIEARYHCDNKPSSLNKKEEKD